MAINLEKAPLETLYYYAEDGKTVGPFPLNALLPKITADTLVYRDGIEWTNAKDVEELRAHFPETEKKPKNPTKVILISLLLSIGVGTASYFAYNHFKKPETKKEPVIARVIPEKEPTGPTSNPIKDSISELPKTISTQVENSPPPKKEAKVAAPKQATLFTCENGQSVRKTLVNNGNCDCDDCSDESKN